MFGFENAKDVLDVLVVPVAIFSLGWILPRAAERRQRHRFRQLIARELAEATPDPSDRVEGWLWHRHLRKRFLHEQVIGDASANRDFVLSLSPDLAYNLAQLWTHFAKAAAATDAEEVREHGCRFLDYLKATCHALGGQDGRQLERTLLGPWQRLMAQYDDAAPSAASPTTVA